MILIMIMIHLNVSLIILLKIGLTKNSIMKENVEKLIELENYCFEFALNKMNKICKIKI
jgi:hypothetical protein